MPEGDRFERAFKSKWRGTYRLARESITSPAEVADKCVSALAETLRKGDGIPGFAELDKVVGETKWELILNTDGARGEAATLVGGFDAIDRIVRDNEGHRHTKVAADVAKSVIQQSDHLNGESFLPRETEFAESVCKGLVDHSFFANARQNLVAEGKLENHIDAKEWEHSVKEAMNPGIKRLAQRLQEQPNADNLRAPNRSVKKQSTAELLGETLTTSSHQRVNQ